MAKSCSNVTLKVQKSHPSIPIGGKHLGDLYSSLVLWRCSAHHPPRTTVHTEFQDDTEKEKESLEWGRKEKKRDKAKGV